MPEKIIRWSLFGLVFFLPISTAFVEGFSGLIVLAFFAKRFQAIKGRTFRFGVVQQGWSFDSIFGMHFFLPRVQALYLPLTAFIIIRALTIVFSLDPLLSIKTFYFKTLQEIMVFTALVEVVKKDDIKKMFSIFVFSSALISFNAIFQHFFGTDFMRHHELINGRATSTFHHPNDLGAYLVMAFFIILGLWYQRKILKGHQDGHSLILWSIGLVLLLVLTGLGWTFSRGAWLSFLLGLLILSLSKKEFNPAVLIVGIVFLFVFVPQLKAVRNVGVVTDYLHHNVEEKKAVVAPFVGETSPEGADMNGYHKKVMNALGGMGRSGFWQEAVAIIKDYPVLGTGLNTYSIVAPHYRVNWGGYPHNCYLHMTAETGFLGLGTFLWLMIAVFWQAATSLKRHYNFLLKGLATALLVFLVHSSVDTNFYSVQLGAFLWLLLGLIVVQAKNNDPSKREALDDGK